MKLKSLLAVLVFLITIFSFTSYAQGIVGVKTYNLGAVSNGLDVTCTGRFAGLIKEFGCNKIDSLIISLTVDGEADCDSLDWYPANWTSHGTLVKGSIAHFAVTLNVAASATGTEVLKSSNAGVASALWRGYEGFYILTRGAAAGNDATDPNSYKVTITFYGS